MRYAEMNRCWFRKRLTKSGVMRAPSRIPSARYLRLSAALIGACRLAKAVRRPCLANAACLICAFPTDNPAKQARQRCKASAPLTLPICSFSLRCRGPTQPRKKAPGITRCSMQAWWCALSALRAPAGEEGARALQWLAERVEGNLLAAHQEIQKLGLLYPPGELSVEQIQTA